MAGVNFPSVAAAVEPYLRVAVDLALAKSSDAGSVAQAGASIAPELMAAELVNSIPTPGQATGSIINTYA